MTAPKLEGESRKAVHRRGGHLQIIASAGSGKTEIVSQRVASLLAEGIPSRSIVAFAFTERAAEELRVRIADRVEQLVGVEALDQLTVLFVGTIHVFCFRLLQKYVPRYETYDVLDVQEAQDGVEGRDRLRRLVDSVRDNLSPLPQAINGQDRRQSHQRLMEMKS